MIGVFILFYIALFLVDCKTLRNVHKIIFYGGFKKNIIKSKN